MMKRLLTYQKYFKWLLWLGAFLFVMGLSAGITAGNSSAIPGVLMLLGGLLLLLGLGLQVWVSPQFWQKRSTQVGTNAILSTLSLLVILGILNFLAARYAQRIDVSENQVFTLSPQSIQVVKQLPRSVKVIAFTQEPDPRLRALLEQYDREDTGNHFSYSFVNPQAQPQLAQEFNVRKFGDIYLESGSRKQFVQSVEAEPLSEGRLTNAIEKVASDRQSPVYFLQGHGEGLPQAGERNFSQAAALLSEKNFDVKLLNLAQQPGVPEDAAVVIMAGPQQDLEDGEVKALGTYLERGGSLLVLIDPNPKPKPVLESFLQQWGVKLDARLAINASRQQAAGFGSAASVVREYGNHPITKDFSNRYSIYPFARPLELVPKEQVQEIPLLITSDQTWAESDLKSNTLAFNPDQGDRPGPLVLGVALSRPVKNAPASPQPGITSPKEARMVVIGNSSFAVDGMFGQYVNGDLFLNSVSWLSKRDDQVLSISPKSVRNRRIEMAQWQGLAVFLLAMGLIPLLGFGTAALVWWKRR